MTKQDHVDYWKISAGKSIVPAEHLLTTGDYVECMFLSHLALEKIIKAHWVKDNAGDVPPKIHHLVNLAMKTKLSLDASQLSLLQQINSFQMEGRYPDFGFNLYKTLDEAFTKQLFAEVKNLYQWLLNKLP